MPTAAELARAIVTGDQRAAARLMRDVDDEIEGAQAVLSQLHRHTGKAHIVGITGNPGAGKSTLVNRLIRHYREHDLRVAVVAVDPTSPFSGGAILGDRIRMSEHATDSSVFIRSVATRGHLGGLSRSTDDMVLILDAAGFDVIIIETVGVGQDEVDVVRTAHTSVVVLVPGMGDEIQALKAGILEIADLFAINKADHSGVDRTVGEIELMLSLRDPSIAATRAGKRARAHHSMNTDPLADDQRDERSWEPPICKVISTTGHGLERLTEVIDQHRTFLKQTGDWYLKTRQRTLAALENLVRANLWQQGLQAIGGAGEMEETVNAIMDRRKDPYTGARELCVRIWEVAARIGWTDKQE